jgi:hypothetical protein
MGQAFLGIHEGLAKAGRVPRLTHTGTVVSAVELLVLMGLGICAAFATAFVDLKLRIPGHAILRAVLPMALGLALVPRRMAGSVMGTSALLTAAALRWGNATAIGVGAMTSLVLTGPFLDVALWQARKGWRLYLGMGVAGLASNVVAFALRAGPKLAGLDHPGARRFEEWWSQATLTYLLCGVMAGLLSALIWFRFRTGRGDGGEGQQP